jgi:UDP-glucose 4-epimerase
MVKVLITGGAGFIGSAMAEKIAQDPKVEVHIVDNLVTGQMVKVPDMPNVFFHHCDVNRYDEIAKVFSERNFQYVFHYAALVGVQLTLKKPVRVLEDIRGIENLLVLSKVSGVKQFFYSSSSEVYGEPVEFPQNEHTTPLNSRLPYAIVKNVGEAYIRSYHKEFGLDYTIFRFFNTYGPKQSKEFVMSKFIAAALNNEDITIYGDGTQTRTFCFIDDNVDACFAAFHSKKYQNDVINIGGNVETKIIDLAKLVIDITGSKSKIQFLEPLKEGDMTRRLPDITKMSAILKRPPITLESGIKKVLENTAYIL